MDGWFQKHTKSMLEALLTPHEKMKELQNEGNFTELMVRQEELKTMPFGEVWNEYCARCGAPADGEWFDKVMQYEKDVLKERM